jgi:hypothetical protein
MTRGQRQALAARIERLQGIYSPAPKIVCMFLQPGEDEARAVDRYEAERTGPRAQTLVFIQRYAPAAVTAENNPYQAVFASPPASPPAGVSAPGGGGSLRPLPPGRGGANA